MAEDSISHHGVKGMHWGVRRASSATSTSSRRAETHGDRQKVNELKKNSNRTLSNEELETIRKRLQLESNVSKLKTQTATVNRGHEVAKTILAVGTTAASIYALSQTPLGKRVIQGVTSKG